jgi:hypothetical protein
MLPVFIHRGNQNKLLNIQGFINFMPAAENYGTKNDFFQNDDK